jgi:hypothetical protein
MNSSSRYETRLFPSSRDGKFIRGFIFIHDSDTVRKLYANGRFNASEIYIRGTNVVARERSPDLEYEMRSCLTGLITYYNVDLHPSELSPIGAKALYTYALLDTAISFLTTKTIVAEVMRLARALKIDVKIRGNNIECNCPKVSSMMLRYIYHNGKPVRLLGD